MISPTRSQADFTPDYALKNSLDTSAPLPPKTEPRLVRQEFGAEADINTLVNRFGPLTRMPGADDFGEFDLTTDLTDAMLAAADVSTAYDRLPPYVKQRMTRTAFYQALANGEAIDLAKPEEAPAPPVAPVPQE